MSEGVKLRTLDEVKQTVGESGLTELIATYSCPLNKEVEGCLKDASRAIQSSSMSSSVTYLALDSSTGDLLGYFTLMMKAYLVRASDMNSTNPPPLADGQFAMLQSSRSGNMV